MKLIFILFATLFHLSNGFTVTLKGKLTEEPCSGEEYADFERCAMRGVAIDPNLIGVTNDNFEGGSFMYGGGLRKLQEGEASTNPCGGCTLDEREARGSFCFTFCGNRRRRVSEDGTDTPDLVAVFEDGTYEGNSEAADIAKVIIKCLGEESTNDPCLPDTANMILTVNM
jgi:hypothetical protein